MSESIAGASLKRTLGPFSVLLFGLAFLAPLIVFGTYGVITQASGNTTAMAYLIAAIGVVFTALSYGRLVRVFPVAGSAYTYTRKMLSANLGFMVGWAALLDYFFIPMLIWLLGASYLNMAFPEVPQWVWIIGFIVSTSLLNILGIQVANRFNVLLMVAQLAIIVVFISLCVHYIVAANGPGGLLSAKPFFNPDVSFATSMAGAAIAAYSFLGFDALSTLSEETRDPGRTLPRAILLVALIGGSVYVGSSYFMYLAHPSPAFEHVDGAAFEIARMIGGDLFFGVVLAGIIIAHFAAGMSFQASVGRLLYPGAGQPTAAQAVRCPASSLQDPGLQHSALRHFRLRGFCPDDRHRDVPGQFRRVSRLQRSQPLRVAALLRYPPRRRGGLAARGALPARWPGHGRVDAGQPG